MKKIETLYNPRTGKERKIKEGYSWTVALFGIIALAFRRQWKEFSIVLLVLLLVDPLLSWLLGWSIPATAFQAIFFVYAFKANEELKKSLLAKGWRVKEDEEFKSELDV